MCLKCDCFSKFNNDNNNKSKIKTINKNNFCEINSKSPIYAVPHQNFNLNKKSNSFNETNYTKSNFNFNNLFDSNKKNNLTHESLITPTSNFECSLSSSSSIVSLLIEDDNNQKKIDTNNKIYYKNFLKNKNKSNNINNDSDDDKISIASTSTTTSCSSWTPMIRLSAIEINNSNIDYNKNFKQTPSKLIYEFNNNKNNELTNQNINNDADLLAKLDQQIAELQVNFF